MPPLLLCKYSHKSQEKRSGTDTCEAYLESKNCPSMKNLGSWWKTHLCEHSVEVALGSRVLCTSDGVLACRWCSSEFQWGSLFSLSWNTCGKDLVCPSTLILSCWWFSFSKFWSAVSKKNVLLLCGKKNKREMICTLHKSKFKVKLHSWDTSKNSMSLFQWSLKASKVMAHITIESCLWQKRDKAEFKILNCELKFLQLVKGSFPYAKKYWAWCKHLFSCSGIAGLWAFHIIYQGTTE